MIQTMGQKNEKRDEMQDLLLDELRLNGVSFQKPWLAAANVTNEVVFSLIPKVHEGKINSYGVFIVESVADLENYELIPFPEDQIDLARKLANGEEYFVLYEKSRFLGLVEFKTSISSEILFIRSFPISGGLIIQRNSMGVTKFFQGDSLTIHDNRRWYTKPNVKTAAWKVSQCVGNIDKNILKSILEFAFHLVSPTNRVGAILVWFLNDSTETTDLSTLNLSIMSESRAKMIGHLLSQVDGATFLDRKGNLLKTGVQLKYSEASRRLIPEFRGTRHTSSLRFSYDLEDAIVVTISEDGPVTVFSSGANIADLQIYSAHKQARLLRKELPEVSEKITSSSFEVVCKECGKNSMIEQVQLEGFNERRILLCPICKNEFYSSECFSLEGRPYKRVMNHSDPHSNDLKTPT